MRARALILFFAGALLMTACERPVEPGAETITHVEVIIELHSSGHAFERLMSLVRMIALQGRPRPVIFRGRPVGYDVEGITLPATYRVPGEFLVRVRGDVSDALIHELLQWAGGGELRPMLAQSYLSAHGLADAAARSIAKHPQVMQVSANVRMTTL